LNFFLGWTVVGWMVAMIWACTADVRVPILAAPGPARYCSRCGATGPGVAHFCWACGANI
jgi:hypothetical protein